LGFRGLLEGFIRSAARSVIS